MRFKLPIFVVSAKEEMSQILQLIYVLLTPYNRSFKRKRSPELPILMIPKQSLIISGTNDKAGGPHYMLKWASAQAIKQTFVPITDVGYPYMK